jgi:hypothetical protein
MALPNPWYIDAEARHLAQQQRLLAYAAVEGKEGVLGEQHLAVTDLDTPGGSIQVLPGGYSILAKHLGGSFEAYVGKFVEAEQVSVNPTDSSGGRTDLVILRVENPYVSGSGSWSQPGDPLNGPYVHVRVLEGVPMATNSVQAVDGSWSAITLARIYRPASTGIVQQSHITDLRSLAKLGGERIVIIDPPDEPEPPAPPISQQYWTESTPCQDFDDLEDDDRTFRNFPDEASWQVPIPSWATGCDVNALLNPEVTGNVYGEMRLVMNGNDDGGAIPTEFNINYESHPGPIREVFMVGGTLAIPKSLRGKIVNMRLQARSLVDDWAHNGHLHAGDGTRANIWINFKLNPSYDP